MVEQKEVIGAYIEKQKENWFMWQINSFLKTIGIKKWIDFPFGWWDKINEYIDLYLDDKKDWDPANISDTLKDSVKIPMLEMQLSITCPYFSDLKKLLDIIKSGNSDLAQLKNNIEKWLPFENQETSTKWKNEQKEYNIEDPSYKFIYPVPGHKINSPFGPRYLEWRGDHEHKGIDIAAPIWTPVLSIWDWVVEYASTDGDAEFKWYWNTIVIKLSNWYRILYAHLASFNVKPWDKIKAWKEIAKVWDTWTSTWAHLHMEIRKWTPWDGLHSENRTIFFARKPEDPIKYLKLSENDFTPNLLASNRVNLDLIEDQPLAA